MSQTRGVYQPLAENVPIYDLSEDDHDENGRSRGPLLIVVMLIVAAAFAGVVWLAYNQGVARGRAGASVVIAAPDGPVRTAPGDSGNTDSTPYTGLKVYGQPLPPDQEAQGSELAQGAPSAPDIIASVQKAQQPAAASPTTDSPPVRLSPVPTSVPVPTPKPVIKPVTAATPPASAPRVAAQTLPKPTPARAAAVPAPVATPAVAPGSAASGKAVLQIGAYESVALATDGWNAFKAKHTDIVGSLSDDVQKVDLGAKGTWYRLRVGPFADRTLAVTACEKLKVQGATCFVAAP